MKEASTSEQPTVEQQPVDQQMDEQQMDEQQADEQRTSLLALSRRSRRAAERETTERETTERETPDTDRSEQENDGSTRDGAQQSPGFRHWYRQRPFIGGVLVVLGGIELFFSGQLDLGNMKIQFGVEGLQATIIPIALVLLGIFATLRPTHHMFYGLIALVLAVYSLIGVNLGGFIIGMLLASIGSVLVVAWMGPREPKPKGKKSRSKKSRAKEPETEALGAERREAGEAAGEERNL